MSNDPVAEVVSKFGDPEAFGEREIRVLADLNKIPYNTPLYLHPANPAVVQIREAMENRAARQQIAELHIGEAWLTVTYGGMKWHHWNMAGMGPTPLSIEAFDEILGKELAPC
jgi:hypothetical protein